MPEEKKISTWEYLGISMSKMVGWLLSNPSKIKWLVSPSLSRAQKTIGAKHF